MNVISTSILIFKWKSGYQDKGSELDPVPQQSENKPNAL